VTVLKEIGPAPVPSVNGQAEQAGTKKPGADRSGRAHFLSFNFANKLI